METRNPRVGASVEEEARALLDDLIREYADSLPGNSAIRPFRERRLAKLKRLRSLLEARPRQEDYDAKAYEAIGRYVVKHARWIRDEHEHYAAAPVAFGANLESPGMRFDALNRAATQEPTS